MTLREVLAMPHREFMMYDEWLHEEWNRPDRHDYYLMQIAARVAGVLSKRPDRYTLDKFKIAFGTASEVHPGKKMSPEHAKTVTALARASHLSRGGNAPITYKTREAPMEPLPSPSSMSN